MDPRTVRRRWAFAVVLAAIASCGFAQSLMPVGSVGLKASAAASRVVDVALDGNWSLASWFTPASTISGQGLKVDLGGSYGWSVGPTNRLSLGAGVGVGEDAAVGSLAGGAYTAPGFASGGNSTLAPRDVAVHLLWRWNYSGSFALTSGLGVRYLLTDPSGAGWQTAIRPTSTTGYVGLQLKF